MNLITIKELSEFIKVKPSTIYSWVHNGTIPFIKLNGLLRFDMDEITRWIGQSKPNMQRTNIQFKKRANQDIDSIIKRAIASSSGKSYNSCKRETSLNQGPSNGKEDKHGAL